jgi:hypothetical protein
MKNLISAISLFLFATLLCTSSSAVYAINMTPQNSIEGVYKTDFGEMTLIKNGNRVTGTYKYKGGKIEGILNGTQLVGTWVQSNAKGKFNFMFNTDFSAFTGKWGYNEATPSGKWNGTKISGMSASGGTSPKINITNTQIAGTYSTDFKEMTLSINGNRVTGIYKHMGGKIDGVLSGNKLVGTWTQSNGKGTFEFVFNADFSAFTGKWGYNNSAPTSKWDGKKIGSGGSTNSVSNNLPVNIAGSWSTSGSRNQLGRIHFWQNGNDFVAIAAWPDETTGEWKSYKGEGQIVGRQMEFKVFPSTKNGTSADQGYVYHMTISPDNSSITGHYTRHGKRTVDTNFNYKLVK